MPHDYATPPTYERSYRTILRRREVLRRVGLSNVQVWRLEKKGEFPARVALSTEHSAGRYGVAVGWFEDEINDWITSRLRAYAFSRRGPGKKSKEDRSAVAITVVERRVVTEA
jgi:prophage regulatory protein